MEPSRIVARSSNPTLKGSDERATLGQSVAMTMSASRRIDALLPVDHRCIAASRGRHGARQPDASMPASEVTR
jgi:hypothetical protein